MALPADKKSIAVTVTKEVYAILKQLAKEDRRSISFIANDFIEEGLKKKGKIK